MESGAERETRDRRGRGSTQQRPPEPARKLTTSSPSKRRRYQCRIPWPFESASSPRFASFERNANGSVDMEAPPPELQISRLRAQGERKPRTTHNTGALLG
ncbi:uncharacterized protein PG998_008104 [Apiospora kogelbergensis]|uniref:uncharacterized protein n=1 Tax=Apiospora kogelbergensis TaxID=1337665 RepID=UPI003131E8F3